MPIIPPITTAPLDTVNSILTAAAVRLKDDVKTLQPTSGSILRSGIYFTQQTVNTAWREMCEFWANIGFTGLKEEAVVTGIPIVATLDPGAPPPWIDWNNCSDGVNLSDAPVLPSDLIIPLKVWERPSGQNAQFPITPMELMFDGLSGFQKQIWNGQWEWRANKIYFPGALQAMDFRILYRRDLADFVDSGTTQWFQQTVPIPRCQDAFSLYICSEFLPGAGYKEMAEEKARLICNREVSMKQRGNVRRQSRSGRLEGGGGCGWGGW